MFFILRHSLKLCLSSLYSQPAQFLRSKLRLKRAIERVRNQPRRALAHESMLRGATIMSPAVIGSTCHPIARPHVPARPRLSSARIPPWARLSPPRARPACRGLVQRDGCPRPSRAVCPRRLAESCWLCVPVARAQRVDCHYRARPNSRTRPFTTSSTSMPVAPYTPGAAVITRLSPGMPASS